ncbi:sulfotransferase [Synechococcus sp. MU1642]|uniref:sulfotransferase n=1 Tax=Synechococcus sp. MU1642 TaxID=2508348 RepID=UPI001CF92D15
MLVDRLVAGGFVRPTVMLRGLQLRRPAHRQPLEAFEASRRRIPVGQLVELPYEALIRQPLVAVKRIYDELGLSRWSVA